MRKAVKARLLRLAQYLYARLKEGSTIRGIVMLTATGWCSQHPEQVEYVLMGAGVLIGLIGILWPDVAKNPPAD
jgi:hypothetical protein